MYWKIPSNYGTLLTGKHQEVCHEAKNRQSLLDHAADLYSDIYSWYDSELKSYDPKATADDELFDPGTGTVVEGIDYLSIMESLSELQTANECKMQRD